MIRDADPPATSTARLAALARGWRVAAASHGLRWILRRRVPASRHDRVERITSSRCIAGAPGLIRAPPGVHLCQGRAGVPGVRARSQALQNPLHRVGEARRRSASWPRRRMKRSTRSTAHQRDRSRPGARRASSPYDYARPHGLLTSRSIDLPTSPPSQGVAARPQSRCAAASAARRHFRRSSQGPGTRAQQAGAARADRRLRATTSAHHQPAPRAGDPRSGTSGPVRR